LALTAVILAAGRGSRLHPYTENCPKCLTEFAGTTLIARQIDTLRAGGADRIVLATGYKHQMLRLPGTLEAHNPNWAETNMVETLFCARAYFGDDVIVSYGDIVYEPRVLRNLLDSPFDVSVVVDRNWRSLWEHRFENPLDDAETLRMDAAGRITDIGQAAENVDDIEAQYMGLMRFRGTGVTALCETYENLGRHRRSWTETRTVANAYMTDLLMEMILTGVDVHAVPVSGGWLEFDTVSDLESAAAHYADGTIQRFFDPAAQ